jgi:hypothetical protein
VIRNRLEELELSCVREDKIRRGAARNADLNMLRNCITDSVSGSCGMEQRKGEAWTLELGELRSCFVIVTIFSQAYDVT